MKPHAFVSKRGDPRDAGLWRWALGELESRRELIDPPGGEQGRAEIKGAGGGVDGTQTVGPGAPRRGSSKNGGSGGGY